MSTDQATLTDEEYRADRAMRRTMQAELEKFASDMEGGQYRFPNMIQTVHAVFRPEEGVDFENDYEIGAYTDREQNHEVAILDIPTPGSITCACATGLAALGSFPAEKWLTMIHDWKGENSKHEVELTVQARIYESAQLPIPCPMCDPAALVRTGGYVDDYTTIVHLNDTHKMSFQAIIDLLRGVAYRITDPAIKFRPYRTWTMFAKQIDLSQMRTVKEWREIWKEEDRAEQIALDESFDIDELVDGGGDDPDGA